MIDYAPQSHEELPARAQPVGSDNAVGWPRAVLQGSGVRLLMHIINTLSLIVTLILVFAAQGGASLVIKSFTAEPSTPIQPGRGCTLKWEVLGAIGVEIDNSIGPVPFSGERVVRPMVTTTYVLTASDEVGATHDDVTVIVQASAPEIRRFQPSPGTIQPGGSSTLSWNCRNTSTTTLSGMSGTFLPKDSIVVRPVEKTAYTLTATGSAGTSPATRTVTVNVDMGDPMIEFFRATPEFIKPGGKSTLSWRCQNTSTVTISGVSGSFAPTGSTVVQPEETTTYELTATNTSGGSSTKAVTVIADQIVAYESEPNDSFTAANPLSESVSTGGLISSATDNDYYKIAIRPGTTARISLDVPLNADFDLFMYRPSGDQVKASTTPGSATEEIAFENKSTESQDYFLKVRGFGGSMSKIYYVLAGAGIVDLRALESEPNGSFTDANPLYVGIAKKGRISSRTDDDYFDLTVSPHRSFEARLVMPSSKDYDLYLYDSAGDELVGPVPGTGKPETIDFSNDTSKTATYYFRVHGFAGDHSSSSFYSLTLTEKTDHARVSTTSSDPDRSTHPPIPSRYRLHW